MRNRLLVLIGVMGGFTASAAHAAAPLRSSGWMPGTPFEAIVSTMVFGLIGVFLAIAGFKLFDLVTPFSLEREICEKQNLAVAILCAGMIIGISLVVAAAVL